MIIYNVTAKIESQIEEEWLNWMQDVHIPDVMQTGCFTGYDIMQLKYPKDDEGKTYAIQYYCSDMAVLEKYHGEYASQLQRDHADKFGNKVVAFRTILERLGKKESTR